jgi:hypothetical protein
MSASMTTIALFLAVLSPAWATTPDNSVGGFTHELGDPEQLRVNSGGSMMSMTERTIEINSCVQPCGTVKKNTRLKRDCLAPLKVGADNITVNLNGYSILAQSGQPGVEVIGRSGVTIKNGTINGNTAGLLVKDGCGNTFRDLKVSSEGESSRGVEMENADHAVVKQLTCVNPRLGFTPFKFSGTKSTISRVACQGESSNGAIISGERLTIVENDFRARGEKPLRGLYFIGTKSILCENFVANTSERAQVPALVVSGDENVVRLNKISGVMGGFGIVCGSRRNVIERNCVTVEDRRLGSLGMNGGTSACDNTWNNNRFTTDSEGDGPKAGHIQ